MSFLTAEEWFGVSVCFLTITVSKRGKEILNKSFPQEFEDEMDVNEGTLTQEDNEMRDVNKIVTSNDFYEVLESLIAFGEWYKHGAPFTWSGHERKQVKASIQTLLKMIKERLPRFQGNGWKIQKFHEMLHLPRDMHAFGSPANYDTGPCENALIYFAKMAAKTAQKHGDKVFQEQCALRVYETQLMEKVYRKMKRCITFEDTVCDDACSDGDSIIHGIKSQLKNCPWYQFVYKDGLLRRCGMDKRYTTKAYVDVHPSVVMALQDYMMDGTWIEESWYDSLDEFNISIMDNACQIFLYSEYQRNSYVFRAHPNYKSGGSWYDWVHVKYEVEENEVGYYPSKILTFFTIIPECLGTDLLQSYSPQIYALIHSCESTDHFWDTTITQTWDLEYQMQYPTRSLKPVYRVVSVETFGVPAYVVEEQPGLRQEILSKDVPNFSRGVILIKEREMWTKEFT